MKIVHSVTRQWMFAFWKQSFNLSMDFKDGFSLRAHYLSEMLPWCYAAVSIFVSVFQTNLSDVDTTTDNANICDRL